MKRAKCVKVGISVNERSIDIPYQIDDEFVGSISFTLPFPVIPSKSLISAIGLWESIFIGQLCLADEIVLQFPVSSGMIDDLESLLSSIYDIRCYRDNIPLITAPKIKANYVPSMTPALSHHANKRACVLWSAGTDSTISNVLLSHNGYEPIPIHFNANVDTAELERISINDLADHLKLAVQYINIDFPDFLPIARCYSNVIARPPYDNSIPHSRELLLLGPAFLVAHHLHASYICFGHGRGMWTARITYEGKHIWRWDTASEAMITVLNNFISKYLDPSISIFSPVAPLSDFRVFEMLATKRPDLLRKITSCFFDRWCGECAKCARYYLYQRALGQSYITFQKDPLKEGNIHLEKFLHSWQNREQSLWADLQYAFYTIVDNEESKLEPLLQYYKDTVYPIISDEMPSIRKQVLNAYPVKFLPENWDFSIENYALGI